MKKFLLFAALAAGALSVSAHWTTSSPTLPKLNKTISYDFTTWENTSKKIVTPNGEAASNTAGSKNERVRFFTTVEEDEIFIIPYYDEDNDDYVNGNEENQDNYGHTIGAPGTQLTNLKKAGTTSTVAEFGQKVPAGATNAFFLLDDFEYANMAGLSSVKIKYHVTTSDGRDMAPKIFLATVNWTPNPYSFIELGETYLVNVVNTNWIVGCTTEELPTNKSHEVYATIASKTLPFQYAKLRYVLVQFEGVEEGDVFAVESIELKSEGEDSAEFTPYWDVPALNKFRPTWVQAEDFDPYDLNGRVAHSHFAGTIDGVNGNSYRNLAQDKDVWIKNELTACVYDNFHTNNLGGDGKNIVYGWCSQNDWYNFPGDKFPVEGSDVIGLEDAFNTFGGWLEYTFDAPEDMEFDMNMRLGGMYQNDLSGDVSYYAVSNWYTRGFNYGIGNNEYSTVPAGNEQSNWFMYGVDDYFLQYNGGVVVYLDGQPLNSTWDIKPTTVPGEDWNTWKARNLDINNWVANDNPAIFYTTPWIGCGGSGDFDSAVRGSQNIKAGTWWPGNTWTSVVSNAPADFDRPDYQNIPVTAGRHTLKIQALTPGILFDYFCMMGHEATGENTNVYGELPQQEFPETLTAYFEHDGGEINTGADVETTIEGDHVYIETERGFHIWYTWTTENFVYPTKSPVKAGAYTWENTKYHSVELNVKEQLGETESAVLHVKVVNPITGDESEIQRLNVTKDGTVTSLTANAIDAPAAPVRFYNMQGQRVFNPANGMFIRVEGNKTSKVILK